MADDKTNRLVIYNASVGLFSGTGSVGDVCKALGMDVVSLDRDMPGDIRSDIMDWDYAAYKPNDFDVVWASPPCT